MSLTRSAALGIATYALTALVASGSEAYVVRYDTIREAAPFPPCGALAYRDELIFHNAGGSDAEIALLGVSNGTATQPQSLTIPAGRIRSSVGSCEGCAATSTWAPDPQPLLWVARLDIPDQVKTVSRLLVLAGSPEVCNGFPGPSARTYAGIPMTVVRALTPAGKQQTLLGADIGGDVGGAADDGRTNVGIYNGGSASGTAVVELRRGCDGSLLEARTVVIPANTIVQVNGLSNVFTGCNDVDTGAFEAFVVVTVDQPSFSYSVTLSNVRLPLLPVSTSR